MKSNYICLVDTGTSVLSVTPPELQTIVQYKCTNYYDQNSEICLNAFDASANIQWPEGEKILSEKDKDGQSLEELSNIFF